MAIFKIKKLSESTVLPRRHTAQDAGIDIYCNEDYELKSGETHTFGTGFASEFPAGYVAMILDRSSLGAKGIHSFAGVIDAGYRGEWRVVLHNASGQNFEIKKGDRIAQAVIQKYEPADIVETDQLSQSERAEKGFGSSGR